MMRAVPTPTTYARGVDINAALDRRLHRARRSAILIVAVGVVVSALAAVYLGGVSWLFAAAGQPPSPGIMVLAIAPLALGLPIAGIGVTRLRILRKLRRFPRDVVATELAMYLGQPALKFRFRDGAFITVITGDLDRYAVDDAIRGRAVAEYLPPARVVR
jgi:hypothetical protein